MRVTVGTVIVGFVLIQVLSAQDPLSLIRTIELPGVEGRIDHLAVEVARQRLFVAALGNTPWR